MGHPEQDSGLLDEVSPLTHASKIVRPLLIAQGKNDPVRALYGLHIYFTACSLTCRASDFLTARQRIRVRTDSRRDREDKRQRVLRAVPWYYLRGALLPFWAVC